MSDPYLLRDGEGNPLSSIFHKPPIKTWVPKSMREHPNKSFIGVDFSEKGVYSISGELRDGLVKIFDTLFTPIEDFHPDDMKGDEE